MSHHATDFIAAAGGSAMVTSLHKDDTTITVLSGLSTTSNPRATIHAYLSDMTAALVMEDGVSTVWDDDDTKIASVSPNL